MRTTLTVLLTMLVAAPFLAGCGPAKDGPAATDSDMLSQQRESMAPSTERKHGTLNAAASPWSDTAAPRAALARWQRAMAGGDKTAYVACFTGSQEELVLAIAIFDAVQSAYAFQSAVVAAYGPEGWKVFETSESARIDLFPREARWVTTLTVIRTGNTAVAYLPRARVPMVLSEEGGVWRIHASGLVPPGTDAAHASKWLFLWSSALRNLAKKVGQKELAADKATQNFADDFKAKLAPEDRPAAPAAVERLMTY